MMQHDVPRLHDIFQSIQEVLVEEEGGEDRVVILEVVDAFHLVT